MIEAERLTKAFASGNKQVQAVRGLDVQVDPGELVAFLGPNGAGKSTSLRLLSTLVEPTGGAARVAGHDIRTDPAAVRSRIGYVGQMNSAGHNQRVRDEIIMQGRFYGLTKDTAAQRADSLLKSLELDRVAPQVVSSLSGGQRRRLDIAMGLVHAPTLLFLDEPSTGLDPQSRSNLWRHIHNLRDKYATTVFMTTHYLDEADAFAERVMVMDHGRVIADDTPSGLKANLIGERVVLEFDSHAEAELALPHLHDRVPADALQDLDRRGNTVELPVHNAGQRLPEIVLVLAQAGVAARSTETRRPTLDDVFFALTGRTLREAGVAATAEASGTEEEAT
ncbi:MULTISPECIES: ATP-binding cassette domain-containing protein [unclassified Actinopolyspora]|uniref:ATP-binding cassette domain-containing protein n=1 Tax=unclassified Actinopolyspora TaxID=2639451 RepID=UPI0013F68789|nr:ATP-binding cassette domain-containing protein [Actinopolyspora sp. BKK2]NHE78738.1 ATP-binding cassette domain-containing protein [Actinopolyspora sp. BKK1]